MPRSKTAWKDLERLVAKVLKGRRILRGSDFSAHDVDVIVDDFPMLRIDGKYRQRWGHHKFLVEVEKKYCKPGDIPLLVTKHLKQRGAVVCLDLDAFGVILQTIRELREELETERNI